MIQPFLKPISVGGLASVSILLILLGLYLKLFEQYMPLVAPIIAYALILGIGLLFALFIVGPLPAPPPIKGALLTSELIVGIVAWICV